MISYTINQQEESLLTHYLVKRVRDKASGRTDSECLYNHPRDVYFIGNLRPRPIEVDQTNGEILNKLAPMAFGAELLLHLENKPIEIKVTLTWACYYRIFPTFTQQCEHQRQHNTNGTVPESTTEFTQLNQIDIVDDDTDESQTSEPVASEVNETTHDRRQSRRSIDSLFIRFRKTYCEATGRIIISLDQKQPVIDDTEMRLAITREVMWLQQIVLQDDEHIRTIDTPTSKVRVPETALLSQSDYETFLNTLHVNVVPEWNWLLNTDLRQTDNHLDFILSMEFVNVSPDAGNSPNIDPYLFDSEATISLSHDLVKPFELELAPHGFRYDRYIWGRGINCGVDHSLCDETLTFTTNHMPIYTQPRYSTRTEPRATFLDLSQDPIPTLNNILQCMENYKQVWREERQNYITKNPDWDRVYGLEYDKDSRGFDEEIERFRSGCELIRTDPDVYKAFQLTNETFRRGTKTEWRLFQNVFLVSQIPGMFELAHPTAAGAAEREKVDIIYFPTGGGKTEAYLGTIVFHCFFDRLRGKKAGVTAWTRFPLRLLTLQQTQRVADIIGIAELVRIENSDPRLSGNDVDSFAVGYFVGRGGSPNEIYNTQNYRYPTPPEDQVTWSKVNDPVLRQSWKRVVRCPSCRTDTVSIDFEVATCSLIHRCSNPNCQFQHGVLPIYIVDNDIFRNLPSVIVGTIDKLAGIGNQRKFTLLFGQVDGRCSVHGYYKGCCCQKDCTDVRRLHPGTPHGLSGPTLFVQDELHLLKEGLGTFDGHYESFTQELLRVYGVSYSLKIIASSATIEAFSRQINHLYGRDESQARIFPGLGPIQSQSFYAETLNLPSRLYAGVISHNKTIFNTILEMIEIYHREIQTLQRLAHGASNPYSGHVAPGTEEWKQLLDFYSTSLTYFLSGRELNSLRTDLEGDVNPNLRRDQFSQLRISELTGSTSTDDVSRILESIEAPSSEEAQDAILATSMVSHGVDIDRLNCMFFYGMPRQNAEYIQASSRVGRTHIGIVFNCLHPIRERDQSHYSYFVKYHEFLGQLVEPVAINRWSKFSINRTLPGLFMGVLLQIIAARSGNPRPGQYTKLDTVRRLISDGSLRPEQFIPVLEAAYCVNNPTTPGELTFKYEISLRVHQYFDWILSPSPTYTFVSDALIPKPMSSLRDVDEPINIELDILGNQWTASFNRI